MSGAFEAELNLPVMRSSLPLYLPSAATALPAYSFSSSPALTGTASPLGGGDFFSLASQPARANRANTAAQRMTDFMRTISGWRSGLGEDVPIFAGTAGMSSEFVTHPGSARWPERRHLASHQGVPVR